MSPRGLRPFRDPQPPGPRKMRPQSARPAVVCAVLINKTFVFLCLSKFWVYYLRHVLTIFLQSPQNSHKICHFVQSAHPRRMCLQIAYQELARHHDFEFKCTYKI